MKSPLKNAVKRTLQKVGIYVQFIPQFKLWHIFSVQSFYKKLQNKPQEEKDAQLGKVLEIVHLSNDHKLYNKLLQLFVPSLDLTFNHAKSIAKYTSESLKRRVETDQGNFFEKTYLNSEPALESNLWFEEHFSGVLREVIRIPQLQKKDRGDLLSILYFELVDLTPIPLPQQEEIFISYSSQLAQLSVEKAGILKPQTWPEALLNYKKLFGNYEESMEKLRQNDIDLAILQEKIDQSLHVLTHGDLHHENAYAENWLIDWDNFGYYPLGIDAAYIFDFFLAEKYVNKDPIVWLREKYPTLSKQIEFADFKRNFLFFLFLNFQMRTDQDQFIGLESHLIVELKFSLTRV